MNKNIQGNTLIRRANPECALMSTNSVKNKYHGEAILRQFTAEIAPTISQESWSLERTFRCLKQRLVAPGNDMRSTAGQRGAGQAVPLLRLPHSVALGRIGRHRLAFQAGRFSHWRGGVPTTRTVGWLNLSWRCDWPGPVEIGNPSDKLKRSPTCFHYSCERQ